MASSPRKLGVLVAIPIKGRKLLNKSGRKQSPYVQLRLSDQKKRTKASLIASNEPEWDQEAGLPPFFSLPSVRLDVFQGNLDMHVAVFDEGKKNELIGEGTLLLHEVIDKGELDVWFPIKSKGASAGDVYFELTFYAIAPPPAAGGRGVPAPHAQVQHPMIRHTQPGFVPVGRPLPNGPLPTMYGVAPGPPAPFPGNTYHPPVGYGNVNNARPYPIPQQQRQHSYPLQQPPITTVPPYGAPPNGPGCNPSFGAGGTSPFRPKTQYNASPQAGVSRPASGGHPNHMPHPVPAGHRNSNFGVQNNNPAAVGFPMTQHSPPGNQRPGVQMPIPRPGGHPNNNTQGYGQTFNNGRPNQFPNNNQPDRRPPPGSQGVPIVTPFVQYNYSMGSFP
ncbi:hypothetical protein BGZ58_010443 [Dissophora ornata]|nr:hypothetical protein BGZ58_010443 [Dissophora ornata]